MDIQKEREAFEAWCHVDDQFCTHRYSGSEDYSDDCAQCAWLAWQAAKAQAVPEIQQALNDRLLVKLIREHVESHISEVSVNDLFDKGWLAAMKCIQNNIDMLEAQEQSK